MSFELRYFLCPQIFSPVSVLFFTDRSFSGLRSFLLFQMVFPLVPDLYSGAKIFVLGADLHSQRVITSKTSSLHLDLCHYSWNCAHVNGSRGALMLLYGNPECGDRYHPCQDDDGRPCALCTFVGIFPGVSRSRITRAARPLTIKPEFICAGVINR